MVYQDRDPVVTATILDVQWSNIPEPVAEAVRELWIDRELGNDYYYVSFDVEETLNDIEQEFLEDSQNEYLKVICDYLTERGIDNCLIHWWW